MAIYNKAHVCYVTHVRVGKLARMLLNWNIPRDGSEIMKSEPYLFYINNIALALGSQEANKGPIGGRVKIGIYFMYMVRDWGGGEREFGRMCCDW